MLAGTDFVVRQELLRRPASEKGCFLRRKDRDCPVGGDQDFQSCRVIAMAMGDYDGVETRQIHAELLDVAREYARIIARIEEKATPAVLDERANPQSFCSAEAGPKAS
jgi:hypothetical protein